MLKIELPEDHPAQFIVQEMDKKMKALRDAHGEEFVVQVSVARTLIKLKGMVAHMSYHGNESEMRCGKNFESSAEKITEAAMCNLMGNLDEKMSGIAMRAIEELGAAEDAINAMANLMQHMPKEVKDSMGELIQDVIKASDAQREEARKNAH